MFARLEQGEDDSVLPYCWKVGSLVGEVEKAGEVSDALWSQVLQLMYG